MATPLPETIAQTIEDFLSIAGARSANTEHVYRTALDHFRVFLADVAGIPDTSPTTLLTPDLARRFAVWLGRVYRQEDGQVLGERSRALYLIPLGRFYRHLVAARLADIDMADYVNLRDDLAGMASAQPGPIEKKLPADEMIAALIEAARQAPRLPDLKADGSNANQRRRLLHAWRRNLALVLALSSSGMRAGEVVALRRGDLEYELHGAWVQGKGGKERFARFSDEAWAAIITYLHERDDGDPAKTSGAGGEAPQVTLPVFTRHDKGGDRAHKPLTIKTVERAIGEMAERAGIAERFNLTPHSLRHYFATRFLRETGDLALTQDALGHADPRTTRVYAKTTREDLVEAHRRIFDRKRGGQ